jgi:hypothetical protein
MKKVVAVVLFTHGTLPNRSVFVDLRMRSLDNYRIEGPCLNMNGIPADYEAENSIRVKSTEK